jgi:phage-related holin
MEFLYLEHYLNTLSLRISKLLITPTMIFSLFILTTIMFKIPEFSNLNNVEISLVVLFFAYTADFGTGLLASWTEKCTQKKRVKVYFFESAKARKSLVKAITYLMLIFFVWAFEKIFFIKKIEINEASGTQLTITVVAICACALIEILSIFENLKRSGFDILKAWKDAKIKARKIYIEVISTPKIK